MSAPITPPGESDPRLTGTDTSCGPVPLRPDPLLVQRRPGGVGLAEVLALAVVGIFVGMVLGMVLR